jgi:gliding motility-associated-like protein
VAVSCFGGNNGSLDVDALNGTSPYTYTLNGSTNATGIFSTLLAGNYSVVVSDQNGCTVAQAVIIAQPSAALASSVTNQTNVSCFGGSNGSVVVTATNGTAPYTYLYNGVSNATGIFSGFANGNYSVLITDQNACTHQQNITITQPAAALNANTVSNTPVDCFGNNTGAITVQGTNGTGPYSYALGVTNNVTGIFTNLLAGAHTIIVTDANNCTFNYNINISQPAAALTALIQSQVNVFCFGSNTGSLTLAASNGTAPYTYGIVGSASSANNVITGLSQGTYNLIVEDNNGCTVTLNGIITQPASGLTGVVNSVTDVLCFGNSTGAVSVTASNGTMPYSYTIAGNTNNTGVFNGLAAGNYNIQLTDANGCMSSVLATVNQPAAALTVAVASFTNAVCNGANNGTATAIAAGGVNPTTYIYQWNTVPVQNTAVAANLSAGTYSVTVTDDNGCIANSSVTILEPNFVLSATADFTICNTQDSLLVATSLDGAAPVTYTWVNLLSGTIATGSNFDAHPNITTNYSVQATDANGCATAPHLFTINVNPLPVASFSTDVKKGCEPLCPTFSAVSTLPNTIWEWNFGDGQSGNGQTIVNCYQQSGLFTPSVTAITDKGCKSTLELVDEIVVFASPKAIFTPNPEQTTIANPNITFINGTSNAEKFTWKFGDNSPLYIGDQAEHSYDAPGTYCIVLYAENNFGCLDSVKSCVEIKPDFHFYVPLAFTPNGDQHNNVFRPVGEALIAYHLIIYNRRGLKIFQSNSIDIGWDGDNQPQDAYSYVIELTTSTGEEKIFSGNVTLLR